MVITCHEHLWFSHGPPFKIYRFHIMTTYIIETGRYEKYRDEGGNAKKKTGSGTEKMLIL